MKNWLLNMAKSRWLDVGAVLHAGGGLSRLVCGSKLRT
jgi:hypothetical protein